MTEKRFTITQDFEEHHRQIRDNGKIIMGCFVEPQAEPIVKLLNELHEENEQLKKDCTTLICHNQEYRKENKKLKQQLLYDGDDVCSICKHEYLTPSGDYFIGKCAKEHKECSKEDIKYCEDFELRGDVE